MAGLGDLPGGDFRSAAYDISSDGTTVVGLARSAAGTEAFLWTAGGGMMGLGDLPGAAAGSIAYGVSGDGKTIVGSSNNGSLNAAFIWDETSGMRSIYDLLVQDGIDMTGWTLFSADAISDDGRVIVGNGDHPIGGVQPWRLDLGAVPEPSAPAMFAALAFAGAASRQWVRRKLGINLR